MSVHEAELQEEFVLLQSKFQEQLKHQCNGDEQVIQDKKDQLRLEVLCGTLLQQAQEESLLLQEEISALWLHLQEQKLRLLRLGLSMKQIIRHYERRLGISNWS
eukprot:4163197-Ditylum_brightwellii.AAC.1